MISAVLELLAELQFDMPPRSKTLPCKDSLEEIAHSHDKHFACEAENGAWTIFFNMLSTSCFPYMDWSMNMQNN